MLKCREVNALSNDFLEGYLPFRLRLRVIWHLLFCGKCRLMLRQLRLLLVTLRQRSSSRPDAVQVEHWFEHMKAHHENKKS